MKSLGWALMQYDCCPYKKRLGHICTEGRPCENTGRRCHLQAKDGGLWRNQPCQHLDLRLVGSNFCYLNHPFWTSLVVQWLRICLPIQGTRVRPLVREDPTCRRATKPATHNYWARVPQLLKPACLEPMLCNKRSHRNEKPVHHNEE